MCKRRKTPKTLAELRKALPGWWCRFRWLKIPAWPKGLCEVKCAWLAEPPEIVQFEIAGWGKVNVITSAYAAAKVLERAKSREHGRRK